MIDQVLSEIRKRQRFLLTSHARPDGDAVGSALACVQILRSMGKQAEVVLADRVPYNYRLLPFSEVVVVSDQVQGEYDAAILLECDSVQRTRLSGLDRHFLISIDHHYSARPFANVNWVDASACSTAEMIFRLAKAAEVKITPDIAACLYTAVLTDTGAFCFQGTGERTFQLAQELVRAGAHPAHIAQKVYFSNTASKMRLLGAALGTLHKDGALAWMSVSRDAIERAEASDEDCEGLVNYALSIHGVEVALFFREQMDGRYRVSLRSKGAVNVATVAEHFGGGGHQCASGCSLEGPLSAAVERIVAQVRLRADGIALH